MTLYHEAYKILSYGSLSFFIKISGYSVRLRIESGSLPTSLTTGRLSAHGPGLRMQCRLSSYVPNKWKSPFFSNLTHEDFDMDHKVGQVLPCEAGKRGRIHKGNLARRKQFPWIAVVVIGK